VVEVDVIVDVGLRVVLLLLLSDSGLRLLLIGVIVIMVCNSLFSSKVHLSCLQDGVSG
jgi:hypothetical protein